MSAHSTISADPAQRSLISATQQGLWLADALHPDSSTYNVFCSARLRGPLDIAALHAAIQAIVVRHDVLRTTFPVRDGLPDPRVHAELAVPLPVLELAGAAEAEIRRVTQQWCEQPFDLGSGPLLRTALIRLGAEDHVLCVSIHHIVSDGQSLGLFFDELAELYPYGGALEPLPAQYADYVRYQLEQGNSADSLDWWADYLEGAPTVLTLPTSRRRPAVRTAAGSTHVHLLPAELLGQVAKLGQARGMSPFMVLLAAYAQLLCRLGATAEVLLGIPFSDRAELEFEPLMGLFVTTLPVRIAPSAACTFGELLSSVRDSLLDVFDHQDVSFDQLVERTHPDRSPSHTPLVQFVFSADLAPFPRPQLAGLTTEVAIPRPTTAKFDLDVSIDEAADPSDGYAVMFNYSTDAFDAPTVERIAERFHRLLAAAVAEPERALATLPLLSEAERDRILSDWSVEHAGYPGAPYVHELFTQQAARRPDAPAVSVGGREYSYAEVDGRADRVAAVLAERGLRPDDVVGVLQHRGIDLVVTLLGVLKAGAAYLPLSPTHPPGYLAKVLGSARARLVITEAELAHRLAGVDTEVLTVAEAMAVAAGELRPTRPDPLNLAYVLYTSGSTGEPKGVAVTHQAVTNVALGMRAVYGLAGDDRVLQFANIGFDIAVEEMYPAWSVGACVVLTQDPPPNPDGLIALMTDERITFTILTSSYWRQWAAAAAAATGRHPGPSLRRVSIGAEPVDTTTLRSWQRDVGVEVYNCYGLTETTVNATVARLQAPFTDEVPSVGRPVAGATAYVLDQNLEPVPVGVEGEFYIGGDCLARGYLGRPDLTAERFVPNPFVPGGRLHRSGDRARWRPDGTLEVLGRVDNQLKVNGYRIEPGHVEATLCAHPDVTAAAVLVRDDRLIGYVVPRSGTEVPADLRGHLAGNLPPYLVPAALVAVPELTLSINGKLDRDALPVPGAVAVASTPAGTDLERLIAEAWCAALGAAEVGVHDNFFEIGGNSQALATVHARLTEGLGRRLPLVTLYEHPTIAALARHVSRAGTAPVESAEQERVDRLRSGRNRLAGRRNRR